MNHGLLIFAPFEESSLWPPMAALSVPSNTDSFSSACALGNHVNK
jgi:hypothetical protein